MKPIHIVMMLSAVLLTSCEQSCEKVIDIDPGDIEPYAVLISKPKADTSITVRMTWSQFFLDEHPVTPITDATVNLDVNGSEHSATNLGEGNYRFGYKPQPGDTLTISAFVPNGNHTLTAGTRVPATPDFDITDHRFDAEYSYYQSHMKIKIHANGHQYYKMRLWSVYLNDEYDSVQHRWVPVVDSSRLRQLSFSVDDQLIVQSSALEVALDEDGFSGDELLFSSDFFGGSEYEFEFYFDDYWYYYSYMSQDSAGVQTLPYIVELIAMSDELFRYETTATSVSGIDQLFSEPTQVFCNIDGGIGIFAAQTSLRKLAPFLTVPLPNAAATRPEGMRVPRPNSNHTARR